MAFKTASKKPLFKDVQLRRPIKNELDFLNWKSFTGRDDLLVLCDNKGTTTGYMDMVTILGKDLDFIYGAGSEGASTILKDYHLLLKVFLSDFDILITQMPADTGKQQVSWSNMLGKLEQELRTLDPKTNAYEQALIRRDLLRTQLRNIRDVEHKVMHEAYTAFIYGKTEQETRRNRDTFRNVGGTALETRLMQRKQKEYILEVLLDPTRQLKGETKK